MAGWPSLSVSRMFREGGVGLAGRQLRVAQAAVAEARGHVRAWKNINV
jgi:hypothetical protein